MREILKAAIAATAALMLLAGCGDGSSRTDSSATVADGENRDITLELAVGEHRDVNLPIEPESSYSVSSRTLQDAGAAEGSLSCSESLSSTEVAPTGYTNVSYGVLGVGEDSRSTLRLIGSYPGEEVICLQVRDSDTGAIGQMRVRVTVTAPDGWGSDDIIDGSPIDPDDPGDGGGDDGGDDGGDPGGPPAPPTDPGDPGEKPEYDPDACRTVGFYNVVDTYNDVEGKFGPDGSGYIRSTMPGSTVDSQVELFYPAYTTPTAISFTDLGRYKFRTSDGVMVEFDLQMGQHIFGRDKKYFYVESNDHCMRGAIPGSAMVPPDKNLQWVSDDPQYQ
jgi:hypothetical protein